MLVMMVVVLMLVVVLSMVNNIKFFDIVALDAYCLLEVYDVLKAWVEESKIHVNMEPELPAWKWLFPECKR